jgi:tetraprenyl-beta-curcumene synthase
MNRILYPLHSLKLISRFVKNVFPKVNYELEFWREYAAANACPELSEQALASIRDKKFHCLGGSIYSLYQSANISGLLRFIVALQTISDYLDNLCDRGGIDDEQAFRQLHLAMADALDPDARPHDYYAFYPYSQDGGYLSSLVSTCQEEVSKLPSYDLVKARTLYLAGLYSSLQTYKHLSPAIREKKMEEWLAGCACEYPELSQWEFAAACGSTLGIFILCAAAGQPDLSRQDADAIFSAYFPWIDALHILLDYFIDGEEDRRHGDLNFVFYYPNKEHLFSRLSFFTGQSFHVAKGLPHPEFNRTVIDGLLSMYLSDPKTSAPWEASVKKSLLHFAGNYTQFIYQLCKLLRWQHIL